MSEKVTCGLCKNCEFWIHQYDAKHGAQTIGVGTCNSPHTDDDMFFVNDHSISYGTRAGAAMYTTERFGCVNFQESLVGDYRG